MRRASRMGQCQSSPTAHDEGYRLTGRSNRIHPMMQPWGKSFGVMWGKCSNMGLAKMASSANIGSLADMQGEGDADEVFLEPPRAVFNILPVAEDSFGVERANGKGVGDEHYSSFFSNYYG